MSKIQCFICRAHSSKWLSHLDRDLRQVVRVTEAGSDVQFEVSAVLYDVITQSDVLQVVLSVCLFEQDWFKDWVQFLSYILYQARIAKLQQERWKQ